MLQRNHWDTAYSPPPPNTHTHYGITGGINGNGRSKDSVSHAVNLHSKSWRDTARLYCVQMQFIWNIHVPVHDSWSKTTENSSGAKCCKVAIPPRARVLLQNIVDEQEVEYVSHRKRWSDFSNNSLSYNHFPTPPITMLEDPLTDSLFTSIVYGATLFFHLFPQNEDANSARRIPIRESPFKAGNAWVGVTCQRYGY